MLAPMMPPPMIATSAVAGSGSVGVTSGTTWSRLRRVSGLSVSGHGVRSSPLFDQAAAMACAAAGRVGR